MPFDDAGTLVRSCDEYVEGGLTAYPCRLIAGHTGPHSAIEIARSVRERAAWEAINQPSKVTAPAEPEVRYVEPEVRSEPELVEVSTSGPAPAPTRTREGDQPLPIINQHPYVVDDMREALAVFRGEYGEGEFAQTISVIARRAQERKQIGIQRYGTALQPFNGRDVAQDIEEELIDLLVYLWQAIMERRQDHFAESVELVTRFQVLMREYHGIVKALSRCEPS